MVCIALEKAVSNFRNKCIRDYDIIVDVHVRKHIFVNLSAYLFIIL